MCLAKEGPSNCESSGNRVSVVRVWIERSRDYPSSSLDAV